MKSGPWGKLPRSVTTARQLASAVITTKEEWYVFIIPHYFTVLKSPLCKTRAEVESTAMESTRVNNEINAELCFSHSAHNICFVKNSWDSSLLVVYHTDRLHAILPNWPIIGQHLVAIMRAMVQWLISVYNNFLFKYTYITSSITSRTR